MFSLPVISYGLAAIAFMLLSLFAVVKWRACVEDGLLLLASVTTFVWACLVSTGHFYDYLSPQWLSIIELLRNIAWFALLIRLVFIAGNNRWLGFVKKTLFITLAGVFGSFIFFVYPYFLVGNGSSSPGLFDVNLRLVAHIVLSLTGLFLLEQWYRNIGAELRWSSKFLCLGIASIFAFDFFLYSDALLFGEIDVDFWGVRGIIYVMVVPLIGISISRSRQWMLGDYVSHRLVFHS
ncbi:MAG: hypothetical protein OEL79_07540, partial [Chromatiales bacterium]|nr:hypothetical protein [Chromatiales bacterium]